MTKTFSSDGSLFTCVFDVNGVYGSIAYDFSTGDFTGHKPEILSNNDWLICCRKFVAICFKMVTPFLD